MTGDAQHTYALNALRDLRHRLKVFSESSETISHFNDFLHPTTAAKWSETLQAGIQGPASMAAVELMDFQSEASAPVNVPSVHTPSPSHQDLAGLKSWDWPLVPSRPPSSPTRRESRGSAPAPPYSPSSPTTSRDTQNASPGPSRPFRPQPDPPHMEDATDRLDEDPRESLRSSSTPLTYVHLVAILEDRKKLGETTPMCSTVAEELTKRHPNVYLDAGVP